MNLSLNIICQHASLPYWFQTNGELTMSMTFTSEYAYKLKRHPSVYYRVTQSRNPCCLVDPSRFWHQHTPRHIFIGCHDGVGNTQCVRRVQRALLLHRENEVTHFRIRTDFAFFDLNWWENSKSRVNLNICTAPDEKLELNMNLSMSLHDFEFKYFKTHTILYYTRAYIITF